EIIRTRTGSSGTASGIQPGGSGHVSSSSADGTDFEQLDAPARALTSSSSAEESQHNLLLDDEEQERRLNSTGTETRQQVEMMRACLVHLAEILECLYAKAYLPRASVQHAILLFNLLQSRGLLAVHSRSRGHGGSNSQGTIATSTSKAQAHMSSTSGPVSSSDAEQSVGTNFEHVSMDEVTPMTTMPKVSSYSTIMTTESKPPTVLNYAPDSRWTADPTRSRSARPTATTTASARTSPFLAVQLDTDPLCFYIHTALDKDLRSKAHLRTWDDASLLAT
ncbi:unnamed protein product, partial [Amoebophrya sp. A25]